VLKERPTLWFVQRLKIEDIEEWRNSPKAGKICQKLWVFFCFVFLKKKINNQAVAYTSSNTDLA